MLSLAGVLPVSAFNVGLAAGVTGIAAGAAKLGIDVGKLAGALQGQIELSINLPVLPSVVALLPGFIAGIALSFNPATIITASVDAVLDTTIELGLIEAQLAIVEGVAAGFEVGLAAGAAGGLGLWSYSGRAAGFGSTLAAHMRGGWAGVGATDSVSAVVIACEDPAAWATLGATFNTGRAALATPSASEERLYFDGFLSGGAINIGVAALFDAQIQPILLDMRAAKAACQASLQVAVGLNLPDIDVQIAAAGEALLRVDQLFANLIEGQATGLASIAASIATLNAQIQLLTDMAADLTATLSAGGFAVWTYEGAAGALGTSLEAALASGLPLGSGADAATQGLVVASADPAAWSAFGSIFAVA